MRWLESQIETRARLDKQVTERAYAELASSVANPRQAPTFVFDDLEQADGAVCAALRYCGVEPGEVPANETDLENRIEYLCRPSGTMRRTVRLEPNWYKNAFGALLGQLDTGEPIALLPQTLGGYKYHDPSTGRKVKVNATTAAHIEPEAVFFYRPLPSKPLSVRDLVQFIFNVFDVSDYLLVLLAAIVATVVGLLPAWANQVAFGVVIPSGQEGLILPIGMLLLGVAISTALINICRNLVMERVSLKLDIATEAATFARLLSLPTSFFKQYSSGNLSVRVSQVSMLTQLITSLILGSGLTFVLSIVYLFQIAAYASSLVLPALLIVLVQATFTALTTVLIARYNRLAMDANAKLSGTVTALLNGIQKIKLAGAENRAFAKWAHSYSDYARATYNIPGFLSAVPAIVAFIGMLGTIAIYYFAGVSQMNIADYMSFNVAYGQMNASIMIIAGAAAQFAQIKPMAEMVAPILEAEPEIAADKPSVETLTGGLEVSGVSFRYNESSPYVINNLSFKVRPGEYVALVGKSGCGKSTIMRLLLGFEKPERGSIFYGPYDVSKVDLRSLRQSIGTVMQDGKLFMGDIFSNITISSPTATLDDAWAAAELAGIADDIRKMPMGMQTIVTEGGGGVSGGQRQRLMIARAICGKRSILMFDEATSALDNKTQKHVSDSLDSLKCTRIVVAHRLSTVRHCDRILVVDGGTIAEEGTYEELIERDGIFAELVARQRLDTQ
ncbi:MAG: NHLP bacteriocin export ABC transporter permease/ATPase subunit [Coriobacteriaceae bacterium]|nr:NHLP bacteriocin export ABC transporter permease/ATPase subunit [Coriobacteriaceae bacterium]